jgi:hypothetical protein
VTSVATEHPTREVVVNSTAEVRGDTLLVNVKKRIRSSMFTPTLRIPLDHVMGAEADPQIERRMWRAWVLSAFKPGTYHPPDPALRFYHPHHFSAHKAIVIQLKDESCERLVVEVDDPDGVVAQINQAVGASSRAA